MNSQAYSWPFKKSGYRTGTPSSDFDNPFYQPHFPTFRTAIILVVTSQSCLPWSASEDASLHFYRGWTQMSSPTILPTSTEQAGYDFRGPESLMGKTQSFLELALLSLRDDFCHQTHVGAPGFVHGSVNFWSTRCIYFPQALGRSNKLSKISHV